MRDATGALWGALAHHTGLIIVRYHDAARRRALIEELTDLAPAEAPLVVATTLLEVYQHPEALVLYMPADEGAAVLELDGERDRLRDRPWPLVLFLLRGGTGGQRLFEAPGLASWAGGADLDPEELSEVDPDAARAAFESSTGLPPALWLAQWRAGKLPNSLWNRFRALDAEWLVGLS